MDQSIARYYEVLYSTTEIEWEVKEEDRIGNKRADDAADKGANSVMQGIIIVAHWARKRQEKVFSEVYDEWIRRFGKLPLNWGKPLNYEWKSTGSVL